MSGLSRYKGNKFAVQFWGGRCAYCLKKEINGCDHFVPRSKGGPSHKFNMVPACRRCNQKKSNKHPNKWCKQEQVDHIVRYFNALYLSDMYEYEEDNIGIMFMIQNYKRYISVRRMIKSNVRIIYHTL